MNLLVIAFGVVFFVIGGVGLIAYLGFCFKLCYRTFQFVAELTRGVSTSGSGINPD
jgi:hypothetical protein